MNKEWEKLKNKMIINNFGTQMPRENISEVKQLCPLCKKESFEWTESGIGDFKNGGNCCIGECQECGYRVII
jgi:hypothetical protein